MVLLASSSLLIAALACTPPPPQCDNTCVAGSARCAGSLRQSCVADADGCLSYGSPTSCGASSYCSQDVCVQCNPATACTENGANRCANSFGVQTCAPDTNGCLSWSSARACGTGRSCFAGKINDCVADPCSGVPASGICLDAQRVSLCGTVTTGQGELQTFTYSCQAGTACQVVSGTAQCKPTGACTPGVTTCADSTHLTSCNAGTPVTSVCPGQCLTTALGGVCGAAVTKVLRSATLKYVFREANGTYSDWSTSTVTAPISGVLVLSRRGTTLIDAQTTGLGGDFQINVPTPSDPSDTLIFVAAAPTPEGGLAYVLANPGFASPGTQSPGALGANPAVWQWSITTSTVTEGGVVTIPESSGSGALRVFDYARYTYANARGLGGRDGLSVVIWLGMGTSWSCGACFAQLPTVAFDTLFQSQLWIPGSTTDQRWWSDAVTAHELGHWAMASYGTSPGEGGSHVLGVPSMPGLAWSEGWATWHSAMIREDAVYYDKQGGAMFWVDLEASHYSTGQPWPLPTPAGGLLQNMDENEVSSLLWSISHQPGVTSAQLFTALTSTRMNKSPWARGYTRHVWSGLDGQGKPLNPADTGLSTPALPDFLDALRCGGISATAVDAATKPATQYPYPSNQPLCQ